MPGAIADAAAHPAPESTAGAVPVECWLARPEDRASYEGRRLLAREMKRALSR